MHYRTLGRSTLAVSATGLGCMSMSGVYGKGDDVESIAVIHHALDLGVNFLDTSDMYGWGHNEELVGRAILGRRHQVVLATKFGNVRNTDGSMGVNGRPEHVPQACDASLRRLGVDTIDLYYQHRVDPNVPIEETAAATTRASNARTSFATSSSCGASSGSRRRRDAPPRSSRSRGSSRRARTWCRSRAPSARNGSRKTWAR